MNHNLGDSVAEVTVSEPKCHFQHLAFEMQVQSMSAIKCRGNFRIFQFASAMHWQKKLPKSQQKPLYIKSAMASTCLCILPKAMIWFFNNLDYLFYVNYIVYL